MTRTITLYRTTKMAVTEVDHKLYSFTSKAQEVEIANEMAKQHGVKEGFVTILDGDGAPLPSFNIGE